MKSFLNTYVDNIMIKTCLGSKKNGLIERSCQSGSIFYPNVSKRSALEGCCKVSMKTCLSLRKACKEAVSNLLQSQHTHIVTEVQPLSTMQPDFFSFQPGDQNSNMPHTNTPSPVRHMPTSSTSVSLRQRRFYTSSKS